MIFEWTPARVELLGRMVAEKIPYARMANQLGCSLSTVYYRVNGSTPQRLRPRGGRPSTLGTRGWEPLPAGHPASWGAISDRPWPGSAV